MLSQVDVLFGDSSLCGLAGRNTLLELRGMSVSSGKMQPTRYIEILTKISISPNVLSFVSGRRK